MTSVVKKDDAVSPVIGTILLVAITVVLVAIVAAVVMGMTNGVQSSKDVGFTVGSNTTDLILTPYGGKDLGSITQIIGYNATSGVTVVTETPITDLTIGVPVGLKWDTTNAATAGSYPLNLVGTFTDGSTSVIYTGSVSKP